MNERELDAILALREAVDRAQAVQWFVDGEPVRNRISVYDSDVAVLLDEVARLRGALGMCIEWLDTCPDATESHMALSSMARAALDALEAGE